MQSPWMQLEVIRNQNQARLNYNDNICTPDVRTVEKVGVLLAQRRLGRAASVGTARCRQAGGSPMITVDREGEIPHLDNYRLQEY